MRMLLRGDLKLRRLRVGTQNQLLVASEGSRTFDHGNELGWYSLMFGASIMQDTELCEYSPSHSSSSVHMPCSHELLEMGPRCKNPTGHCPYTVNYLSEGTSISGYLFEDQLHLAIVRGNKSQNTIQAAVIICCGSKQSGSYLDGIAPDGLMGLGPGDISITSLLVKSGLVPHSFSFCSDKSYGGSLFFGDKGPASQRSTPFLPLNRKLHVY